MTQQETEADQEIQQARKYLRGEKMPPRGVLDLAKRLRGSNQQNAFRWARQILGRARTHTDNAAALANDPDLALDLGWQHSLCTYKDPDLPSLVGLNSALAILRTVDHPDRSGRDETLGQTGAIYKRLWEATGQKLHLEKSYSYYRKAYDIDPIGKNPGYCGINAAYVLDLLADLESRNEAPEPRTKQIVAGRRDEAAAIRTSLAKILEPLETQKGREELKTNWWYLVTRAEAHFGLDQYAESDALLRRAKQDCAVQAWEYFSTARQLASLHQLRPASEADRGIAVDVLARLLSDKLPDPAAGAESTLRTDAALKSAFRGRIGLALSGGGFRSSLFHLGVLAKLAELDLLREVEVLSCVSGGSIVGAQYYLELRRTLQETHTETLSVEELKQLYIGIVRNVMRDFLAGVQRNIRNRVFANPIVNLRTMLPGDYDRTVRLGELFERELFVNALPENKRAEARASGIWLNDLKIDPVDSAGNHPPFDPKTGNWRRRAKVPILVLNATSLNTGHNWQYTVSWMGESPHAISLDLDANNRLRRMWYDRDAPRRWKKVRLGHAVVASACVPGLFEPVRLPGAYGRFDGANEDARWMVRHVDGGVHDNQGTSSLLEQGCSVLLVSDASGQSTTQIEPGGGVIEPLLRTNAILMQRVREEQFRHLQGLQEGGLIKGVMTVHLKLGLDVRPVGWVGCEDPAEEDADFTEKFTAYGMRKTVQEQLAGIRTDLDCFSEVEAFALMMSGYRMVENRIVATGGLELSEDDAAAARLPWEFQAIDPFMNDGGTQDPAHLELMRLLATGRERLFKVWRLLPRWMSWATGAVGAAVLVGLLGLLAWACYLLWDAPIVFSGRISGRILVILLAISAVLFVMLRIPAVRRQALRLALGGSLFSGGGLGAGLNVCLMTPIYLRLGSLRRLEKIK